VVLVGLMRQTKQQRRIKMKNENDEVDVAKLLGNLVMVQVHDYCEFGEIVGDNGLDIEFIIPDTKWEWVAVHKNDEKRAKKIAAGILKQLNGEEANYGDFHNE